MNTDAPWPDAAEAEARVLGIQTKLHQWATDDPARRFDDLYNLVYDPAFLLVAWRRVRGNKGPARPGWMARRAYSIDGRAGRGAVPRRAPSRPQGPDGSAPLPVRERMIPKPGGKLRRLGIADRRGTGSCKPPSSWCWSRSSRRTSSPCSYGFRPGRRAQDAIAEIHLLATRSYEWVLEGDITACFDEIDHTRAAGSGAPADRRQACPGAGEGVPARPASSPRMASNGTRSPAPRKAGSSPRCWPTSPSRSSTSISPRPGQAIGDLHGSANGGADAGPGRPTAWSATRTISSSWWPAQAHAEALRERWQRCWPRWACACRRRRRGSPTSTRASTSSASASSGTQKRGTAKRYIYTYPSKKALAAVKAKVRTLTSGTTNQPLAALLHRLNPVLRGWTTYFRHGVSKATFSYLRAFAWRRVVCWLRRKHPRSELDAAAPPLPPKVVADRRAR